MYFVCFLVVASLAGCFMYPLGNEPRCHSKFDYDEKLLSKLIRMEMAMDAVVTKVEQIEKSSKHAIAEMQQKSQDIENNFIKLKEAAEKSLDAIVEKAEASIATIRQQYEKLNVVFHVKDVNGIPTANDVIKFSNVVENAGGAYSLTTGCFTAPIQGTYWFAAHICTKSNNELILSLFIRDTLVSRMRVYDRDDLSCGSVSAVSELQKNDEVCVKSGPSRASNPLWKSSYGLDNFMGALVN